MPKTNRHPLTQLPTNQLREHVTGLNQKIQQQLDRGSKSQGDRQWLLRQLRTELATR
jgi:hypothetical protein